MKREYMWKPPHPYNHFVLSASCRCKQNIESKVSFPSGNREAKRSNLSADGATAANLDLGAVAKTSPGAGKNAAAADNLTMNNGDKDTKDTDVQKLQEQLNDIKEQVRMIDFVSL